MSGLLLLMQMLLFCEILAFCNSAKTWINIPRKKLPSFSFFPNHICTYLVYFKWNVFEWFIVGSFHQSSVCRPKLVKFIWKRNVKRKQAVVKKQNKTWFRRSEHGCTSVELQPGGGGTCIQWWIWCSLIDLKQTFGLTQKFTINNHFQTKL